MKNKLGKAVGWLRSAAYPGGGPGVLKSLATVAAVSLVLLALDQFITSPPVAVAFILPVLVAAIRWGTLASLVAALAGLASSAFFFYEPKFSFQVDEPGEILDLFTVAVVTGQLASRLRREAATARKREISLRSLYALSHRLATAKDTPSIFAAVQQYVCAAVGRSAVLFGAVGPHGEGIRQFGAVDVPDLVRAAASDLCHGRPSATAIVDDTGKAVWLLRSLSPGTAGFGVIAVHLGRGSQRSIKALQADVDVALADAASAIQEIGIANALNEVRLRTETDRFREALIGSVSHELRTPLASILGATTVLCKAADIAGEQRIASLAGVVRDEAERLDSEIQNLLDASRIHNDGLRPKRDWADLADIVNAALERRRVRLADHVVDIDMAKDLPLVHVDSRLLEQALSQVLDNAGKYSDKGSRVRLRARSGSGEIVVTVSDAGTGVSAGDLVRLGERFFRGSRHTPQTVGTGLGLWIAKAFMAVNGGSIEIASEGKDLGTTVSLHIPLPAEDIRRAGDSIPEGSIPEGSAAQRVAAGGTRT